MSDRTASAQAEVDWLMLVARGSVRRDMLAADRRRWHAALRARAREHGHTIECGHHGRVAWAVLGYQAYQRHNTPRYSEHAEVRRRSS